MHLIISVMGNFIDFYRKIVFTFPTLPLEALIAESALEQQLLIAYTGLMLYLKYVIVDISGFYTNYAFLVSRQKHRSPLISLLHGKAFD